MNKIRTCAAMALTLGLTTSVLAGPVTGATAQVEVVRAYDKDVYSVAFRAGESARVYVSGDGDTDLDVYIYDANGNLITFDDDESDTCLCRWTPRWTGTFRIEVRNLGRVSNRYFMRVD